jgi:hypothetical protein
MKVRMLTQTNLEGVALLVGQEVEVNQMVGDRWLNNGIAEAVEFIEEGEQELTLKELMQMAKDNKMPKPEGFNQMSDDEKRQALIEQLAL